VKHASELEIKELMPYNPEEFQNALQRLLNNPSLAKVVELYFPQVPLENFVAMADKIKNTKEFQQKVISTSICSVLQQTSGGLTLSGLENYSPEKKRLFISNHRDIICDPALFTNAIFLAGHDTPKICLGDNLLTHPIVTDLVKMNKGLTVKRNLSPRELLKWSLTLSEIIHQEIEEGIDSVWIAQREGRAKDGNDCTHPGVIKMLTLGGTGSFEEKMRKLHIVPVSISYEYDPCDVLKSRELYINAAQGHYTKGADEDTKSMITGIKDYKGRIHIQVGTELNAELDGAEQVSPKKNQINIVVKAIDLQIQQNYKNWPSNFIAYDLLNGATLNRDLYSKEQYEEFVERMEKRLSPFKENPDEYQGIRQFFLQSYANSVKNALLRQISKP
jgi:hypothetical protein